eukprot:362587-Chlamydomonas_euryale.AAC.2
MGLRLNVACAELVRRTCGWEGLETSQTDRLQTGVVCRRLVAAGSGPAACMRPEWQGNYARG